MGRESGMVGERDAVRPEGSVEERVGKRLEERDEHMEEIVAHAEERARELYPNDLRSRVTFLRGVLDSWGTAHDTGDRDILMQGVRYGKATRHDIPLPEAVAAEALDALDQFYGRGRYAEQPTGNRGNGIFAWQLVRRYRRRLDELIRLLEYPVEPPVTVHYKDLK